MRARLILAALLFASAMPSADAASHMFFEPSEWRGKKVPRFTRIIDLGVIARLVTGDRY
jgi:hypothetical protein